MSIFEFMSENPFLTFLLAIIIFGQLSDCVKYISHYHKADNEQDESED